MGSRRHQTVADARALGPHDHTLWFGDGARDLHQLAALAFQSASARNERMLLIAEDPRRELLTGLDDVDRLIVRDQLRLLPAAEVYDAPSEPAEQRARFEDVVAEALADGYSGVCVVADNTRMIGDSRREFDAWLAWEATADELQSTRPLLGVCYFDRRRVPAERMADLASMHPVVAPDCPPSLFQLFCDGDALKLVGELDALTADRIRRVVAAATSTTGRELDFSELAFIDHQSLRVLDEVARTHPPVRVRGAKDVVQRLWKLLDVTAPALEFSS